eukprot:7230843-Heterocapsa_arctica.AAC.1
MPANGPRDHRPLLAVFNYILNPQVTAVAGKSWDWEKIRKAMRTDKHRGELPNKLEEVSERRSEEWFHYPADRTPDVAWQTLIEDVQEAGKQFALDKKTVPEWVKESKERRGQLLDQRIKLRKGGAEAEGLGQLKVELEKTCKELYRWSKDRWKRRQHQLSQELEEANRSQQPARAYVVIRQLAAKGAGSKK